MRRNPRLPCLIGLTAILSAGACKSVDGADSTATETSSTDPGDESTTQSSSETEDESTESSGDGDDASGDGDAGGDGDDGVSPECDDEPLHPCDIPVDDCHRDRDGDGLHSSCDNASDHLNPDQRDMDKDGFGDPADLCPTVQGFSNTQDSDKDNIGPGLEEFCGIEAAVAAGEAQRLRPCSARARNR